MPYVNVDKLADYRKSCGLTNEEIADRAGIATSTVSKVLTGSTTNPSIETLAPIVIAMGGSLDELCGIASQTSTESVFGVADKSVLEVFMKLHNDLLSQLHQSINRLSHWLTISVSGNLGFVGLLVFVLIFDITHPAMGWVQYTIQAVTTAADKLQAMLSL